MLPYTYAIDIDYEKKDVVSFEEHTVSSDDFLDINAISKIIGDGEMSIESSSDSNFLFTLVIRHKRLESDLERDNRVKRDEAYMVKYKEKKKERAILDANSS